MVPRKSAVGQLYDQTRSKWYGTPQNSTNGEDPRRNNLCDGHIHVSLCKGAE